MSPPQSAFKKCPGKKSASIRKQYKPRIMETPLGPMTRRLACTIFGVNEWTLQSRLSKGLRSHQAIWPARPSVAKYAERGVRRLARERGLSNRAMLYRLRHWTLKDALEIPPFGADPNSSKARLQRRNPS